MLAKFPRISGFVAVAAAALVAYGCTTDKPKSSSRAPASPTVAFAGLAVSVTSSRSTLQVGDNDKTALITVAASYSADWSPIANGTEATLTTTLGAFDSPTGGKSLTLELVNGKATAVLFAGSVDGLARVKVEIEGITAQTTVTIEPDPNAGVVPVPAPVQATLTLQATPGTVSQADTGDNGAAPTSVVFTATVLGDDGNPFKNAGIFMTSSNGLGTFSSGTTTSGIFKTNSLGQVNITLSIADADLLAYASGSFTVVAHMGVTGGEKTASVTVTVLAGPAPDEATSVDLTTSVGFVTDDGTDPDAIDLDALVYDQHLDGFPGVNVTFMSTLGNPDPPSDLSNGSGIASSSLDLTAADVANHPSDSFTITAKITTSSGTATDNVVITIVREEQSKANNVLLSADTVFVKDDGGGAETVTFTATVQDQFGAVFEGGTVTFTKTFGSGSFDVVSDTSDSLGEVTSTLTLPAGDITAFGSNSFTVTATLTRPGTTDDTASLVITIVRPPVAAFHWVATGDPATWDFFDDSTGPPTSWAWDFDADTVTDDSTARNPSGIDLNVTCGATDPCPVKLTVTNAAGSSSVTHDVPNPP